MIENFCLIENFSQHFSENKTRFVKYNLHKKNYKSLNSLPEFQLHKCLFSRLVSKCFIPNSHWPNSCCWYLLFLILNNILHRTFNQLFLEHDHWALIVHQKLFQRQQPVCVIHRRPFRCHVVSWKHFRCSFSVHFSCRLNTFWWTKTETHVSPLLLEA